MAMNHFTPGAPVEIFESEYPLRVRCFELVRDSAGPGKFRGGLGYAREFEVLEDSVLTVRSSNHKFASKGVGGGGAPRLPRVIVNPYSDKPEELGPIETRLLKAGDIIRFERSGGAGFGDPLTRARETVADDVRNGYISRGAAMQVYGLTDPPAD
jgi:N-methylhydantoinase B